MHKIAVEQLEGAVFRTQTVFHTILGEDGVLAENTEQVWECGGTGKKRDGLTVAAPNFEARAVNVGHTQTSRVLSYQP